jgi:hypothetical protein
MKTMRQTLDSVMIEYVTIPKEIMELNKNVSLASDVMFVHGLCFIASLSQKIKFTRAEYFLSRKQPVLVKSLKRSLAHTYIVAL